MQRFFKATITTVTVLVGLAALFVLGSLIPIEGNYSFRIVESGSMEPAIKTGSVIATIPRDSYAVGDVVTFEGTSINPMPTTHRIVAVEGTEFVTKGDANEEADYRRISESEVIGKVFLDVPYAGHIATFFGTADGKAALAVLALIFVICICIPWRSLLKQPHTL